MGFWPIVVFKLWQNAIHFNKAKFTEEWIKIFITTVIIGLLIKFYDLIIRNRTVKYEVNGIKESLINLIDNYDPANNGLPVIIYHLELLNGYQNQIKINAKYIKRHYQSKIQNPNLIKGGDEDRLKNELKIIKKLIQ